jgi:nitrite reductase/ring-hydroxylating ferredoxin subunit
MAEGQRLICAAADLAELGPGVRFEIGTDAGFVIRYRGRVFAYLNRCGHLPVEMDWQPGEFYDLSRLYLICSTHGALYDPATGACISGRCEGRGLIRLPVEERDGGIFLKD